MAAVTVPARGKALVPTGLSVAIPEGTYARIGMLCFFFLVFCCFFSIFLEIGPLVFSFFFFFPHIVFFVFLFSFS